MSSAAKSILIVDDEASLRESLAKVFRCEGYRVRAAADGTEAAQMCREHAFDLVLMDWQMPGGNGSNLLRELSELNPRLPVIVVTGKPDEVTMTSNGNLQVVMAKPLDLPILVQRVGLLCSGQVTSALSTHSQTAPLAVPMTSGIAGGSENSAEKPLTPPSTFGVITSRLVEDLATRSPSIRLEGQGGSSVMFTPNGM